MLQKIDLSSSVKAAIAAQIAKGGYKLPSLQSFRIEEYGNVGAVLYAGNM